MADRRSFLLSSVAVIGAGTLPAWGQGTNGLKLGPRRAFSFGSLAAEAQALAARPYVVPPPLPASLLDRIDYEALGKIHFDTDYALFRDGPGQFPATFFLLGRYSRTPARMYVVEEAAEAREIIYDSAYFVMPPGSPAHVLPAGAGFGGFRFQESRLGDPAIRDWRTNDWVAFQGASYFRAIGELYEYGISARGLTVNVATPGVPEEFPAFTRFYFETPAAVTDRMTVYAFLEGASVAGAYRFVLERTKAVVMEVEARIFQRANATIGLTPLTSMYWFSETKKPTAIDWRPEVHDSDGLAMWAGSGERIWRPLNDPKTVVTSSFEDSNPRGFGLFQRDRVFDHYLDGVHYERRPSLWVEPLDNWGEGSVELVEIPTDDEINDNIVAYWRSRTPSGAGSSLSLRYRLYWTAKEPFPPPLAVCVATRLGRGGQPGKPRPKGVTKFVVEFLGGPLKGLAYGTLPEAVLSAPSGRFSYVFTEAVPDGVDGHWRAQFDFRAASADPVEMRLYLRLGGRTLTETWLYQYHPIDFNA
ncbi:MAG: glucan biosynthesis protein [Rhizomicrobium sp.]